MRQIKMNKIYFLPILYMFILGNPIFAQNQTLRTSVKLATASEHFLGLQNGVRSSDKDTTNFNINYNLNKLSSKLAINYNGHNKFTFDGSELKYNIGMATFGVGAIDRHWSFSDKTSLILSHNARPSKSVYLKLNNEFKHDWLPSKSNWSLEVFNGFTKSSINSSKSMLLGIRATLSTTEGFEFELVKTSQWGGKNYSKGMSALGAALILDTNDNSYSDINKMAGFGISYNIPGNTVPLRIYGQAIGEDESGNLPSCYAYLAGLEWSNTKTKYPIRIGIETVDTRVDVTEHGNCGPNTMYNNGFYDYTNYGDTMGAAIDTEGNSLELFGQSQISKEINIKYSTKFVNINDANWADHRLSSKKQSGLINSLGASWSKNNIRFNGNIYYQDFTLDKTKIKNNFGIGFSSSVIF